MDFFETNRMLETNMKEQSNLVLRAWPFMAVASSPPGERRYAN